MFASSLIEILEVRLYFIIPLILCLIKFYYKLFYYNMESCQYHLEQCDELKTLE